MQLAQPPLPWPFAGIYGREKKGLNPLGSLKLKWNG
ncbi:hypothetical protein N752_14920 [Desulforamulus aquiferis]|nr:hypothetical protein N752_14920 [Desulforamulus aquiferis]